MSDFIKKAKQDKDINNGAAIVSSRTDGAASEHHVQNSQLSQKAQTDNESKLENRFGNKFKYFDSAAEITRIQSKGGGVNKTLAQIQSRLSDVKEKSETVVTKAEENKDFNSGGAVSNAGGGSKFSDTLETDLSKKDQSDTVTVINDNIGKSVQTGSNSGSQDAVAVKEEITNNIRNNSIADSTTDSDGLEKGGCPGAQSKGTSRLLPNIISVRLQDSNDNFAPTVAMFGDLGCDCYVPLNLPLLACFTKLLSGLGKTLRFAFNNGDEVEAVLRWFGAFDDYIAKSWEIILDRTYGRVLIGRTSQEVVGAGQSTAIHMNVDYRWMLEQGPSARRQLLRYQQDMRAAKDANKVLSAGYAYDIARLNTDITHAEDLILDLEDALGGKLTGLPSRPQIDDFLNAGFTDIDHENYSTLRALTDKVNSFKKTRNEKLALKANSDQKITFHREQERLAAQDGANLAAQIGQARANANAELIAQRSGDALGVLPGLLGYTFEALAALDPVRNKVCLGPGTTLNKETCACECQPGTELCGGGDPLQPSWSLLDFISPVQSDELKRCYPPCPCNMKRTSGGPKGSNCECTECKDGYTWYAGNTCDCERTTGYVGTNVVKLNTERGTCIKTETANKNISMGKTWDTTGCGWKCGAETDVGSNKHFGAFHRLNDNYPAVAPSKHHILYAQGCTYVCDGRDRPEGTPWPPDCPGGFFNYEKCECAPTNCPQYNYGRGGHIQVLQSVSVGYDEDTGEPIADNFYSIEEIRTGGSTSSHVPAGITVTPPGGNTDWAIYTDTATAAGYESQPGDDDSYRYVEWDSFRYKIRAFECTDVGNLGTEITNSVFDFSGNPLYAGGSYESCHQTTWTGPGDYVETTSETFLSCLSLYDPVVGVSNVDPNIVP